MADVKNERPAYHNYVRSHKLQADLNKESRSLQNPTCATEQGEGLHAASQLLSLHLVGSTRFLASHAFEGPEGFRASGSG